MKKKGHGGGGGGHDAAGGLRWLLTYADLITLLLVFFIVMAAVSNPEKKKVESLGAAFARQFGVFTPGSKSHFQGMGGGKGLFPYSRPSQDVSLKLSAHLESVGTKGVNIETKKKSLVIRVSGLLLFAPNDATLLPEAYEVLNRVGAFLNLIPNRFTIQGNTDQVPASSSKYASNWELSMARAMVVGHHLMGQHRLDPSRITLSGRAEWEPLTLEQLEGGDEVNRRVDIIIELEGN